MLLPHYEIQLSEAERQALEARRRAGKTPQQTVRRATILLLAQEGLSNQAIADTVGTSRNLVQKWRALPSQYGRLSWRTRKSSLPRAWGLCGICPGRVARRIFPHWPGIPSLPWPAKALRSRSLEAFRTPACGIWPAWWLAEATSSR